MHTISQMNMNTSEDKVQGDGQSVHMADLVKGQKDEQGPHNSDNMTANPAKEIKPEHVESMEDVTVAVIGESQRTAERTNAPAMGSALKILQMYGTSSQSSTESIANQTKATTGVQVIEDSLVAVELTTSMSKGKKSVSFVYQGKGVLKEKPEQSSPAGRRPLTRSMSPQNSPCTTMINKNPSPSLRRMTRFATAQALAIQNKVTSTPATPATTGGHQDTGSKLIGVSIVRKLLLDFQSPEGIAESEEQRKLQDFIEYNPSFDLGFDSSPSEGTGQQCAKEAEDPVAKMEESVVIFSKDTEEPDADIKEPVVISSKDMEEPVADIEEHVVISTKGMEEPIADIEETVVVSSNDDSGDSLDNFLPSLKCQQQHQQLPRAIGFRRSMLQLKIKLVSHQSLNLEGLSS
jgi:hypothetical protein